MTVQKRMLMINAEQWLWYDAVRLVVVRYKRRSTLKNTLDKNWFIAKFSYYTLGKSLRVSVWTTFI